MDITLPRDIIRDLENEGVFIKQAVKENTLGGKTFVMDLSTMEESDINRVYKVLTQELWKTYTRPIRSTINSYKKMRVDQKGKGKTFRQLADAIREYLVEDAIKGWIFRRSDEPAAALVTDVVFHPAKKHRDGVEPAYITISVQTNDRGKKDSERLVISDYQEGSSAGEALSAIGWQKETEELHTLYEEQLVRYKEIRPLYGKQLRMIKKKMWSANDARTVWRRPQRETVKQDLSAVGGGRLVHDDHIPEGVFSVSTRARWDDPDNPVIGDQLASAITKTYGADSEKFATSPYSLSVRVFHLGVHKNFEVHVMAIEIYKYDKTMRDKLVLPDMYGQVLDVLTTDMEMVQEDIVEGKTGGNVILTAGPPGTGKTLTAEVYAEHREVPLYKIHSGQLGTNAASIEEKLMEVYKRATDWGCPVLLDEFDVFGKARGENLEQNAVVAVFLRTLEYQNNTIFLTTNRADDMDDAILSRCSAIINFEYPQPKELKKIWEVQRTQLLPEVTDETVEDLMTYFVEQKKEMSGRNVKSTLQLAARWVKAKGVEPDIELLKTCASFRGI